MGTRADLLAAAGGLASAAKNAVGDGSSKVGADVAAGLAGAAKTALEAAALASNTSASDIDRALEGIQDVLAEAGVLDKAIELPAEEFLDQAFRAMLSWRAEAMRAQGHVVAYERLRDLAEKLESDFTAGGSPTSLRIAGRIHTALDDADQIIKENGDADGTTEAS